MADFESIGGRLSDCAASFVSAGWFPGVAAGAVTAEGEARWCFGETDWGSGRAPDEDTVYEIGSVSKVFAGVLLADMTRAGLVKPEDAAGKYVPGVRVPRWNRREITLRDLTAHVSGLPWFPDNIKFDPATFNYLPYSTDMFKDALSRHVLRRKPGAEWEYSNFGVGLLGLALASRARMPFERLLERRVCRPLGLAETRMNLTPGMKSRLAPGYTDEGKPAIHWNLGPMAPAGEMRSTLRDLLRFVAANLKLVKTRAAASLRISHRIIHHFSKDSGVAMGWFVNGEEGVHWHGGGMNGYRAYVAFNLKRREGAVVLCNGAGDAVINMGTGVMGLLAGREVKFRVPPRLIEGVDPSLYDKYAGSYRLDENRVIRIYRDGDRLMANDESQRPMRLHPESETAFFGKDVGMEFIFEPNEAGKVDKMVLVNEGYRNNLPRVE